MASGDVKVMQWFEKTDWVQAGGRIAAILAVTFVLVYIARRLIAALEKFTAAHAHDEEARKRAATVSNILRKLATTVPVTEKDAGDKAITGSFQELKAGQKAAGRQAEFEGRWDAAVVKNYAEAKTQADKALTAK